METAENPIDNETVSDDETAAVDDAEMQAALDPESATPETDPADEDLPGGEIDEDPIAVLEAKIAELNDKHLRAVSDAENTRRIAARDRANDTKYKNMDLGRDLLGVVDNMTMALASIPEESREADANLKNLYVGIDMTMNELLGAFERNSIKPIDAMGKQFDHNLMEAISQVPNADVNDGTVVQVVRRGFMLHDRLLRPAQVIVATGGPKAEQGSDGQSDGAGGVGEAAPEGAEKAYENQGKTPGSQIDEET